ncbi:MAG: MBL fold metallo-hydrolase [Spirochaetaceae bacterium]
MKKIKLTTDLYQYQFPPFNGDSFGYNIHVLIAKNEALLIDTGFEEHTLLVKADLEQNGISITHVVFSHFHPDHISGLCVLDNPKLFGSIHFQQSLDKFTPVEKHVLFNNLTPLAGKSELVFGNFNLQFKLAQGHVVCGMFTIINKTFVQVADDIMTSNEGDAILPSVKAANVQKHINSLEFLKGYSGKTLLLSHGNAITGDKSILTAIKDRQQYLKAIAENPNPISIEKAITNCNCDFLHKEWHNFVYS